MVVQMFGFDCVVLEPIISLVVNIFDKQRVKSINISDKQLPFFLDKTYTYINICAYVYQFILYTC